MTPLFLGGMCRTGTTIMAKVLDSHPQISMTGEQNLLQVWFDLTMKCLHDQQKARGENWENPPKMFGIAEMHLQSVRRIINSSLRAGYKRFHMNRKPDAIYWGDKWINSAVRKKWVERMLGKECKFIITQRNLRDTVASIKAANFILDKSAEHWVDHCSKVRERTNVALKDDNAFLLDFDRMQEDKEAVWQELADWLELPNKFDLSLICKATPRPLTEEEEKLVKKSEEA